MYSAWEILKNACSFPAAFEWRLPAVLEASLMVHRREGRVKLQQRRIRRIIFSSAHYDSEKREIVSSVTRLDVVSLLRESVKLDLIPDVEVGEVLMDARGRGSFQ
jgi:hypothetical protein